LPELQRQRRKTVLPSRRQVGDTTLNPFTDFVLPDELIISERPPALPEIYEPAPLSQLDDLEAMPANQVSLLLRILCPSLILRTKLDRLSKESLLKGRISVVYSPEQS
jgi:hypothetical protein